jgi:galactonate dehydratase
MFATVGQFLALVKGDGVAILQPQPMSLGRVAPTQAVAAANGARIAPHQSGDPVAILTRLQLAAAAPNFLIQEHFDPFNEDWAADLGSSAPHVDPTAGHLVTDRAGKSRNLTQPL